MQLLTGVVLLFVGAMAIPSDIVEYFKLTDLSAVKWQHAVNSKAELEKAIDDKSIQMVEADVRFGKLNGQGDDIPIMAHDKDSNSDLSLASFLEHFETSKLNDRKIGMKLDFKDINAFNKLDKNDYFNKFDVPVWINADILEGPGSLSGRNPPVEIHKVSSVVFEKPVLYSLGWTTGEFIDNKGTTETPTGTRAAEEKLNEYTTEHINAMTEAIKNIKDRNITFPVRAMYLSKNIKVFEPLIKNDKYTLTVWSAKEDELKNFDIPTLSKFLIDNSAKVFVDIPKVLQDAIDKERNAGTSAVPLATSILAFIAVAINILK